MDCKGFGRASLTAIFGCMSLAALAASPASPCVTNLEPAQGFFVQNVGQYPPDILFYSDIVGGRLWVRRGDIVLSLVEAGPPQVCMEDGDLRRHPAMRAPGEDPCIRASRRVANVYIALPGGDWSNVIPEGLTNTKINLFLGNDPSRWHSDIPTFGQIRVPEVSRGVDLILNVAARDEGLLRFEGEPPGGGGMPRILFDTKAVVSDNSGGFKFSTPFGDFGLTRPTSRPRRAPSEKEAAGPWAGEIGGGPDGWAPALNGQTLLWGTYVGGSKNDYCRDMALDSAGNIVFGGFSESTNIPVPAGYDTTINGGCKDIYVAKLAASGNTLLWGTYIGGNGDEEMLALALDASGTVTVGGYTKSTDIPVPGGYQTTISSGYDAPDMYIARLSSSGSALLWGTYVGGGTDDGYDFLFALALDAAGNVVFGGQTGSTGMPVPGGYDTTFNGYDDIYVAKLSSTGSDLLWGTFIGGTEWDLCNAIAVTPSGKVVVGGQVRSTDMPVPGGYDQTYGGGYWDIYVAELSPAGNALLWGTYLGGNQDDSCQAVAVDGSENVVIGADTGSPNMPVPGGYDQQYNGGSYDMYAAKLSSSGIAVLWGTYIGGSDDDGCYALVLDASGNAYLGGWTRSSDMPVPLGFDATFQAYTDFYIAKVSASGKPLLWGTYLGGNGSDSECALALDASGTVVVGSSPSSSDLPVPGGFDTTHNGAYDIYLAKLTNPVPCTLTCSASATPTTGTFPLEVEFVGSATSANCDGVPTYSWAFGDGATADTQNADHTYTKSGTFTWVFTVKADGVTCAKTGTITVTPPCTMSCSANASPASGLAPLTVTFTAFASTSHCSSSPSFSWTFGDGGTSENQNASHTYTSGGTFTWTMIATVQGVSCSKTGTIVVTEPCAISCTASAAPAAGAPPLDVAFSASATAEHCSGAPSFSWVFGDGATSTQQSPTHVYAAPGSYTWSLTVSVDGKTCSQTGTVDVAEPCVITCAATAPAAGRAGDALGFAATADAVHCAGAATFAWSFGDGGTSAEQDPYHTYASAGSYSWTLTVTADDRTCAQTGTVAVSEACAVTCTASATPASGEAPLAVSFIASSSPSNCTGTPTFAWTLGDGAASTVPNPSHTYAAPGTFSWTMTVTVEGKTCSQTGTVTVMPPCVLACAASATLDHGAAPLAVGFAATVHATDCVGDPIFLWSFGDGETSSEPTPGHTYAEPGTYAWSCTVTGGGKACSASGSVTVNPGLPGDANNDGIVSIGEVQQAINMFLEVQPPGNGVDCSGDGSVSIGEVQKVINAFLGLPSSC